MNRPHAVTIAGRLAYVADGEAGLFIHDIQHPSEPILIARCDTPESANSVPIINGHAYVADGTAGLLVLNIKNPANPTPVAALQTQNAFVVKPYGRMVAGNYAYMADDSAA